MKPYVITAMTLVAYDGAKIPLEVVKREIITRSVKSIKEQILDSFSAMKNRPIDVELKIKYV